MGEIHFHFAWRAALQVRYRRQVRELTQGAVGRFASSWRWVVDPQGDELLLRPEEVHVELPEDTREVAEYRPLLDAIWDRPLALRVGLDGGFRDVAGADRFRQGAGVSERTLSALSPSARALVEHAASDAGQRASARDLWDSLVGFCVEVEVLDEGEPVLTPLPSVSLPFLGASVPMLLQAEARDEGDHARVILVTEPDPEALVRSMGQVLEGDPSHSLLEYALRTTTELRTDPATLIPRRLTIEREHQVALRGPAGIRRHHTLEAREWVFDRS